jgi:hypothetical protein
MALRRRIYIGLSVIALIIGVIAADLYLTSQLSDAYKTAVAKLENSPDFKDATGGIPRLILIGSNFELRPNSISCAGMNYLVVGSKDISFLSVDLRKRDFHNSTWDVIEITRGWNSDSVNKC